MGFRAVVTSTTVGRTLGHSLAVLIKSLNNGYDHLRYTSLQLLSSQLIWIHQSLSISHSTGTGVPTVRSANCHAGWTSSMAAPSTHSPFNAGELGHVGDYYVLPHRDHTWRFKAYGLQRLDSVPRALQMLDVGHKVPFHNRLDGVHGPWPAAMTSCPRPMCTWRASNYPLTRLLLFARHRPIPPCVIHHSLQRCLNDLAAQSVQGRERLRIHSNGSADRNKRSYVGTTAPACSPHGSLVNICGETRLLVFLDIALDGFNHFGFSDCAILALIRTLAVDPVGEEVIRCQLPIRPFQVDCLVKSSQV